MALTTGSVAPARQSSGERLLTRAFVLLSVADLAYFTAVGVAIYTLPSYVTGPIGSGEAGAGLAFGAFAVTALVLRPIAGRLSDTRGRRPLLVGGALLGAAMMLLTAFAPTLPTIIVLRLGIGVAEAAFFVASFAVLADLAPPSRMGEALSYNSLGLYVGLSIGPPLGELLVGSSGFTTAWCSAAVLLLVAAAVVARLGETRPTSPSPAPPTSLIHWKAVPPAIGFLASVVAMGGFLAFASLHADSVGMTRTSVPLAAYGLTVVGCRVTFAKAPDRLPSLPLGAAALAVIAAGTAVAALWAAPAGMVTGAVLMGVGVAFSTPAFFSAVFATAGPSERGAASGTASAFLDLGLGGGPILLGLVGASLGIPWAFGAAAGVAVAGGAWTMWLARLSTPRTLTTST